MKLLENMEEMGGTIHDAIQYMVNDMFQEELDDDVIDNIVNSLSLSNVLELDTAYTNGDKEAVRELLGNDIQLEYSMGNRADVTSVASTRQSPTRRDTTAAKPAAKPAPSNSNYSGGVQNGVTTVNNNIKTNQPVTDADPEDEVEENNVINLHDRMKHRNGGS